MNKSPDNSPRDVCILRLSAIGDTCHVLPVVRSLQRAWPETRFTWVIGTLEASLMQGTTGIEFITFDKRAGRKGLKHLRTTLGNRKFDLLLHMNASMRANLVSMQIKATRRLGFDRARARDFQWLFTNQRIEAKERQHVLDGLFGFAEALGVSDRNLHWDIPVDEATRDFASKLRNSHGPTVLISPCSSQRHRNYRNWPAHRFSKVIEHLINRQNARIFLTGGNTAAEREYARLICAQPRPEVVDLIGTTNLKQLLALIQTADVVICPDSGPAHMATAAGTPVVGLFATSNPGRTGPYLSQQWVVNKYPQAVRQFLSKSEEQLRWGQRVRDPGAMELIEVADVTAKLDSLLAQRSQSDRN